MPNIRQIKWYGCLRDQKDPRDFIFKSPEKFVLPPVVDYTRFMPPAYNQSSLGSCTAQSGVSIYQFNQTQQGLKWRNMPSRNFLYYNTRVLEGTVSYDSGATIRNTIKSLAATGVCCEKEWPYNIKRFAIKPPRAAYISARKHRAVSYQRLMPALTELKGCLAYGETFIFGFSVPESFEGEKIAKTGVLEMPSPNEGYVGGHAVHAVGYIDADRMFIIRNSWGVDWGLKGNFLMPYDFILGHGSDFWTVKVVA